MFFPLEQNSAMLKTDFKKKKINYESQQNLK